MKIFTIGHSTKNIEEFLDILKEYQINYLVDVRRFPSSKRFPHFNKENLSSKLKEMGINYIHYPDLGGFREEGYLKYSQTQEFRKVIMDMLLTINERMPVIMCTEWDPTKCHRFYISEVLQEFGYEVIHIIDKNNSKPHRELPPSDKIEMICERQD